MAVSVMARCGPSLRPSSASGPRRVQQQPAVGRAPFARCVRVARSPGPARAFYRTSGGPASWDEESMKELMADMAKAWKAGGGMSGGFFWPGAGGAYVYGGSSRCKPNSACGPASSAAAASAAAAGSRALALDVASTEGFYLLFADVPGLAKADLSIKLSKDRVLSVAGERRPPLDAEQADTSFRQQERRYGAFERSWALPDDADSEGISAKVADGVLTITVAKAAPQPEVDAAQDIAIN